MQILLQPRRLIKTDAYHFFLLFVHRHILDNSIFRSVNAIDFNLFYVLRVRRTAIFKAMQDAETEGAR